MYVGMSVCIVGFYTSRSCVKCMYHVCFETTFYWLPKMHKTPVGSRFIAASSSCTTKPLSKLLTSCLNLIIQHFKEYA